MKDHNDISRTAANPNEGASTLSTVTPAHIKNAFIEIMNDEAAHVTFFQTALKQAGATPRPKPTFKGLAQANQSDFATMSRIFENTGVAAFLMAMPAISNKDYTAAAASILTIEARHAGFVDVLLGKPLSENGAFDKPASHAEIIKAVSPFIESLNGGPDPADELNNDMVILNFALLLEYLEAEFYSINVPNLFK
ncbi:MAG: ferritin-like domain-containing protein [Ktedonobacteraceae bacterium]